MYVVVLIGARAGTVQDLPVLVARAMVADGRARWPEGSPHGSPHAPPSGTEPFAAASSGTGRPAKATKRGRR